MPPKEEPIYIGIEDPLPVRRSLLESTKNLIKVLQENEGRKEHRERKHKLVGELKETVREITNLLSHVKSQMPRVKMSSLPQRSKVTLDAVKKEPPVPLLPKPQPVHVTAAEQLDKELREIENKLSEL